MFDAVEAGLNSLRMMPCPGCGERALAAREQSTGALVAACARCDGRFDALAEVEVVTDPTSMLGGCCAGFRRHDLCWREAPGAPERTTRFETWAQDHILLRPGDRVTLLFEPGDLRPGRRGRPMPLMVGNHTMRRAWALVGSAPVVTLR
ncbi:MAG TPA: hypothetical protein VII98_02960 [Solirubrobacteraceae bacterium]